MGRLATFEDDEPFEQKIKTLEDEELLEIWAESQQMEQMLAMEMPDAIIIPPSYEKVIVTELFVRAGRRLVNNI